MKEASEVPNFLEEVDKCRKMCSTDAAELSGQFSRNTERGREGGAQSLKLRMMEKFFFHSCFN